MQLLDDAILDLLQRGKISGDDAYAKSNSKAKFREYIKNPPKDFTEV
jgi:twitching motility protein PilT